MKIIVWKDDDPLYYDLIDFLSDVKIAQGGQSVSATLVRHPVIRKYLKEKQRQLLKEVERYYFNSDGSLNREALKKLASKN